MSAIDRRQILKSMLTTGALVGTSGLSWAKGTQPSEYKLARDLYRYAFPLIFFGRYRHQSVTNFDIVTRQRMALNQWSHATRTVTPETTGAPQTDTLYSIMISDLGSGPLILEIPEMDSRYWSIQCCDFFGSTFAMINRRTVKGPAKMALVGPGWEGSLPSAMAAVHRSPTRWIFAAIRMHFTSDTDRANLEILRAGFKTTSLLAVQPSQQAKSSITPIGREKDPLADFKLLAGLWQDCPPPVSDAAYLNQFSSLGFGPGDTPDIDALPKSLQLTLARAASDGLAEVIAATQRIPGDYTLNGWTRPNPQIGLYHDGDYLYRAMLAQQGIIGTPVSENVYMSIQRLPDGSQLNGNNDYEVIFDRQSLTEAHAFWSMHAYRLATFSVVPNMLNRYAISSRSQGLLYNDDGSLTIYVQKDDPGGNKSNNWLPVRPGEDFMLTTRAYEPDGRIRRLEWAGPQISIKKPSVVTRDG